MTRQRRLSQAISEGDGISLIVPAADAEAARTAEAQGAEGVVVDRELTGLRDATGLPILWRDQGLAREALSMGADACLVAAEAIDEDGEQIERRYAEALDLGLDCAVEVRDEEELEQALERLDPEIFLLSPEKAGGAKRRSSTCSSCSPTSRPESLRSPTSTSRAGMRSLSSSAQASMP